MDINRIKSAAAEKGVTLSYLCDQLGVSGSYFADVRRGKNTLPAKRIEKIADILDVSTDYLLGKTDIKKEPASIMPVGDVIPLRILASVRAGYGGVAVEEWDGEILSVPSATLRGYDPEECRLLRVAGDSMYPRLLDGDVILVHVTPSVDSGDIAVMLCGDEATVKRVEYVPGEDWFDLIPANPEYPTHRVEGAALESCRVFGKVLGIIWREV